MNTDEMILFGYLKNTLMPLTDHHYRFLIVSKSINFETHPSKWPSKNKGVYGQNIEWTKSRIEQNPESGKIPN